MSWNIRIPTEFRPSSDLILPDSFKILRTIAVDDSASAEPTITALTAGMAKNTWAHSAMTTAVTTT